MIYAVSDKAGAIKIGYTARWDLRAKAIGTMCAHGTEVLCMCEGDRELERFIHAALKSELLNGEWFRDVPSVRKLIGTLADGGPSTIGFQATSERVESQAPDPFTEHAASQGARLVQIILARSSVDGALLDRLRAIEDALGLDQWSLWVAKYKSNRRYLARRRDAFRNAAATVLADAAAKLSDEMQWVASLYGDDADVSRDTTDLLDMEERLQAALQNIRTNKERQGAEAETLLAKIQAREASVK